jgi:hypothetical protein
MALRMLATTTDELREACSRARAGDLILVLPDVDTRGVVLPQGASLLTVNEAIRQGIGLAKWAIDLYRAM